jgi:SOS-response transcriptional repressor LexA
MKTLKQRTEEAIEAGFTVGQLSAAAGKSSSAASQWLSGGTKTLKADSAAGLASLTGWSAEWWATGKGSKHREISVTDGPDIKGQIPLISWVQAGDWNGAHDPLQPGEAERWLECPVTHSERTYALRVRGDSMTAPHGNSRSYPEGCIVFVDPLRKSPVNGARIIAKLNGSDEVTFKVFKQEDGRIWLQPINNMHQPIMDKFKVLGTVIGKWEDE